MKANYSNGGVRAPDVVDMYKSYKLSWLSKLFTGGSWMASFSEHITKYGNFLLLLNSNYDNDSLKYLPTFYREIFIFAKEIFNIKGDYAVLWNNQCIKIDNKTVFWKDWFNRNIIYIYDLMVGEEFLSYDEFCEKYQFRPNFLQYFNMINAIKQASKHFLEINEIVNDGFRPKTNFA